MSPSSLAERRGDGRRCRRGCRRRRRGCRRRAAPRGSARTARSMLSASLYVGTTTTTCTAAHSTTGATTATDRGRPGRGGDATVSAPVRSPTCPSRDPLSALPPRSPRARRVRRDPARRARRRPDRLRARRAAVRRRLRVRHGASALLVGAVVSAGGMASSPCSCCARSASGARSPIASRPGTPHDDDARRPRELAAASELARDAGEIALARPARRRRRRGARRHARSRSTTDIVTEFDRAAEAHIVEPAAHGCAPTTRSSARRAPPTTGTQRLRVVHRPDRRHHQLRLRPAGVVVLGRRGPRRRDDRRRGLRARRSTSCSRRRAAAAPRSTAHPIRCSTIDRPVARARRHRVRLPPERRRRAGRTPGAASSRRSATSAGSARRRSTCAASPPAARRLLRAGLNSWDLAAGELIAREAGAVTSDFAGGPARPDELVAAAPGVHSALIAALGNA